MSEREILACGSVLSSIVDEAKHLAEETNQAVAASMARSEEITLRFVKGMREDILAQENAVQNVLDLASRIEEAIVAINDLTMSSKVLAINARIEAARLGAQGRGFAVIAGSLGELSSVIRAASDKVGSAINAVREGLPSVRARAASSISGPPSSPTRLLNRLSPPQCKPTATDRTTGLLLYANYRTRACHTCSFKIQLPRNWSRSSPNLRLPKSASASR